jgi:hypothetical protein
MEQGFYFANYASSINSARGETSIGKLVKSNIKPNKLYQTAIRAKKKLKSKRKTPHGNEPQQGG